MLKCVRILYWNTQKVLIKVATVAFKVNFPLMFSGRNQLLSVFMSKVRQGLLVNTPIIKSYIYILLQRSCFPWRLLKLFGCEDVPRSLRTTGLPNSFTRGTVLQIKQSIMNSVCTLYGIPNTADEEFF